MWQHTSLTLARATHHPAGCWLPCPNEARTRPIFWAVVRPMIWVGLGWVCMLCWFLSSWLTLVVWFGFARSELAFWIMAVPETTRSQGQDRPHHGSWEWSGAQHCSAGTHPRYVASGDVGCVLRVADTCCGTTADGASHPHCSTHTVYVPGTGCIPSPLLDPPTHTVYAPGWPPSKKSSAFIAAMRPVQPPHSSRT